MWRIRYARTISGRAAGIINQRLDGLVRLYDATAAAVVAPRSECRRTNCDRLGPVRRIASRSLCNRESGVDRAGLARSCQTDRRVLGENSSDNDRPAVGHARRPIGDVGAGPSDGMDQSDCLLPTLADE